MFSIVESLGRFVVRSNSNASWKPPAKLPRDGSLVACGIATLPVKGENCRERICIAIEN